jgi:hypothetical protein
MLPDDTKARKHDLQQKIHQTQVNEHFDKAKPEDKPEPYSDELFKEAAIQWLVETDQVCTTSVLMPFFLLILSVYYLADSSCRAPVLQKDGFNRISRYTWSEDPQPQTYTNRNSQFIQASNESSPRTIKCKLQL